MRAQSLGNVCASQSNAPWFEWISHVQFNTIDNISNKVTPNGIFGFSDFTSLQTVVNPGQTYSLNITPGLTWYGEVTNVHCRVWIDFNGNNIFEDNEQILEGANQYLFTTNVQSIYQMTPFFGKFF